MKITKEDILHHIESLGLRSTAIHDASAVEAILSQPRAVLIMCRKDASEERQQAIDAAIQILTDLIGDRFDLPVPPGVKVRKSGKAK